MSKHDSQPDPNVHLDVGGWISGPCLPDLDAIREYEQRTHGDQRLRPQPEQIRRHHERHGWESAVESYGEDVVRAAWLPVDEQRGEAPGCSV